MFTINPGRPSVFSRVLRDDGYQQHLMKANPSTLPALASRSAHGKALRSKGTQTAQHPLCRPSSFDRPLPMLVLEWCGGWLALAVVRVGLGEKPPLYHLYLQQRYRWRTHSLLRPSALAHLPLAAC
eukprot:CAMPEP_0196719886 /NCGR_PEP_ID=MMETSP1091-20130531/2809_1 /TAXON_ID=302021 /ORGANISM="Rhodomonas sp., Strain CCMP768" /LENGTH=125 /DNA_ID=CAMNT_0042060971 /DNA_START=14 /DNA_END=391 /DNA_ORIENTATION=-